MKKGLICIISFFVFFIGKAQVVYEDINNVGIYEFLDELANLQVIEINSVVKPYSRQFIAERLVEALERTSGQMGEWASELNKGKKRKKAVSLNKRQMKELLFYLQDYQIDARCSMRDARKTSSDSDDKSSQSPVTIHHTLCDLPVEYDYKIGFLFKKKKNFAVPLNPLAFQYKDSLFTLSLRPIGGFKYMVNENGSMYHRYWGASAFIYIGKYFGGYASLRDNYATELLSQPEYFTQATGGVYKINEGGREGGDWSEMRGGLNVSWNWGSIGVMKDFLTWGNNYHGANILSGHAPSFPYIQLHINPVKWFDFYYIHGWLSSMVVDSSQSYWVDNTYRVVFHNKYIAANILTFSPWSRLNISLGNSIIYSGRINPAFFIPFMFFKSIDNSMNSNNDAASNSQFFFDISSRQIKYLHIFITLFIDELKVSRIFTKGENNFTSWKFGLRVSDFPLKNLSFTGEFTRTLPITYKHYIATTSFSSSDYTMGNYMRDNSQYLFLSLSYKPIRGLCLMGSITIAEHGNEYMDDRYQQIDVTELPILKNITFRNLEFDFVIRYELANNIYFKLQYINTERKGDLRFGPEILHGKTNTFLAGLNIGF